MGTGWLVLQQSGIRILCCTVYNQITVPISSAQISLHLNKDISLTKRRIGFLFLFWRHQGGFCYCYCYCRSSQPSIFMMWTIQQHSGGYWVLKAVSAPEKLPSLSHLYYLVCHLDYLFSTVIIILINATFPENFTTFWKIGLLFVINIRSEITGQSIRDN